MAIDTVETTTTTTEAPEGMEFPKPGPNHEWLQKFVGEWTYEAEMACGPDVAPMKTSGTMSVRSLGGLWMQGEFTGDSPGGTPTTNVITVGYDYQKVTYVGTFISSMMDHLWVYHEGTRDGDTLTLVCNGPSFTKPGETTLYHDIVELVSDDYHTLTGRYLGDDGTWVEMMKTHYRRVK